MKPSQVKIVIFINNIYKFVVRKYQSRRIFLCAIGWLHVESRPSGTHRARSIQPKFPEISVQNSMDRFGPTGKVSKKRVYLLRWTTFPGWTGLNFG